MSTCQLHPGNLPQPHPCVAKKWQTKQWRAALCSPIPVFPAVTFLWQICTPVPMGSTPQREASPSHHGQSELPPTAAGKALFQCLSRANRTEKITQIDPVCSCHYMTFDSGSLELLLKPERVALSTFQSCRFGPSWVCK